MDRTDIREFMEQDRMARLMVAVIFFSFSEITLLFFSAPIPTFTNA